MTSNTRIDPEPSRSNHRKGFPCRAGSDQHYIVHKVRRVWVKDGVIHFRYTDSYGKDVVSGPQYMATGHPPAVPIADAELLRCGPNSIDQIRFIVAYHSGALPPGVSCWLLKSPDNLPERFLGSSKTPSDWLREAIAMEATRHKGLAGGRNKKRSMSALVEWRLWRLIREMKLIVEGCKRRFAHF